MKNNNTPQGCKKDNSEDSNTNYLETRKAKVEANKQECKTKCPDNQHPVGDKVFIQCGYEHNCKNKDCLKCPKRFRHTMSMTLAEEIVVEDFAVCDLESMYLYKREELWLMQKIMMKLMNKMFKSEGKERR